jgi:branched-chain amino acid aminotransferase
MEAVKGIKIVKTTKTALGAVDFTNLGFGKYISDHMLVADFCGGEWAPPRVVPFGNLSLSPTTVSIVR